MVATTRIMEQDVENTWKLKKKCWENIKYVDLQDVGITKETWNVINLLFTITQKTILDIKDIAIKIKVLWWSY